MSEQERFDDVYVLLQNQYYVVREMVITCGYLSFLKSVVLSLLQGEFHVGGLYPIQNMPFNRTI